jgi:hypothetical protein
MNQARRLSPLWTALAVVTAALAGAAVLVLGTTFIAAGDGDEVKSPPTVVNGLLPEATQVPRPSTADARSIADFEAAVPSPALESMLSAFADGRVDDVTSMMATRPETCQRRDAPVDCESVTGAIDGVYSAVTVDGGIFEWTLSERQARELWEILLRERPTLTFVSRYTEGEHAGDYLVAFSVPPVPLGEDGARLLLEGVTLSGFGVRFSETSPDAPILAVAPLSPTYGELAWAQDSEPAIQSLVAPASLDGFRRIDDD